MAALMPDLTFTCPKPCSHLLSRYVAEGAEIRTKCQFCGNVIDTALYTRGDGQVLQVSGEFHRHAGSNVAFDHLRLPGDQYDYLSAVDGSHISSKYAHREHLKRHSLVEVGNERGRQNEITIPKDSIRAEMRTQLERMRSHGTWRDR